jgi:uncharacterized membrane protein YcaP (DUF421 family)
LTILTVYILTVDLDHPKKKLTGVGKLLDWLYNIPSLRHWLRELPSLPYPLKALLIVMVGIILLRLAGKRSLAEMTVAEAVLRIAIGTVLIQPLGLKNEWEAIYGGAMLIAAIVIIAKMMQWIPKFRNLMVGVPSVVIKDGKMMLKEIKKAKLTTDEVEVGLRQSKVGDIKDVDLAIFESSGKLSTTVKSDQAVATKKDIQTILDVLAKHGLSVPAEKVTDGKTAPLFQEAYKEAKDVGYKPNQL